MLDEIVLSAVECACAIVGNVSINRRNVHKNVHPIGVFFRDNNEKM